MKKVYIVGGDILIERMFAFKGYSMVGEMTGADIVCFTGGSDVTPSFYNHQKHPTTGCNPERDTYEEGVFNLIRDDQLAVGICRGSQFLCVMNGGTLWQDVDRHAIRGTHTMSYLDEDGRVTWHEVTSTHHQMQNPYNLPKGRAEIWGRAHLSTYRDEQVVARKRFKGAPEPADVEIVYYPRTHSLAFQGHPEYESESCRDLFFTCLDRALKRKAN